MPPPNFNGPSSHTLFFHGLIRQLANEEKTYLLIFNTLKSSTQKARCFSVVYYRPKGSIHTYKHPGVLFTFIAAYPDDIKQDRTNVHNDDF